MLSIPDKKELNIVAQFSCTYNLKIVFFLQCLKIRLVLTFLSS